MFIFTFLHSQSTLKSRGPSSEPRKNLNKQSTIIVLQSTSEPMCSLSLFLTQSFDPPKQLVQMSAATFPQRFDAQDSTFLQTFVPSSTSTFLSNTLYSLRLWSSKLLSIWTTFAAKYHLPHRYCTEFKIIQSSLLSAYF